DVRKRPRQEEDQLTPVWDIGRAHQLITCRLTKQRPPYTHTHIHRQEAVTRDTVKAERVLVEQPLSDRLLLNYGNSENQSFYGLSCSEISASASSSEQKLQLVCTELKFLCPAPV
ncbi:unnamed protein product, partial [Pleuronectes platessa]